MRSVKVGGLGLDENKAEAVLALIKNKGQELPEKFKDLTAKREQAEIARQQAEERKKLEEFQRQQRELADHARASAEITKQKLSAKLDISHELPPPPPALLKRPPVRPTPPPRPSQPAVSPKPRLQDVKAAPKLVGPLEELRNLNLVDFRRLAANPRLATAKIGEQINLLEQDSFAKRLAGIKAWRTSELYRLYLTIGQQSIKVGRLIKEVISERQKNNQPTLTEAEFEAIMDLNKSLRF
jgi:hypothetical protein